MMTGYEAMKYALERLDYWFDTDAEILERMPPDERASHERHHQMIREALAIAKHERLHKIHGSK